MDARQDFGRLERAAANRFLASGLHPSAGLLMTPTGFHHAQSAGTSGLLRTGLPELSRSGPPHATPAGSVSTPSPMPQCPNYLSSLSINTGGSNYGYLHGDAMGGSMPPPSPSPFRTPPGMPTVRHHWSHTPPPPLDSYGRYGLGTSLFSLYPMISSSEASTYCLQASAARLMAAQKVNPYHHIFGSRDFGLYHHGLSMGSPYSPTLSMDPTELGSPSSAIDMERAGTPLDFMCKSANIVHSCPPQQFPPPSTKHLHPSNSYQDLRCSTSADIGMSETAKATAKKRPSKESRETTSSHSKPSPALTAGSSSSVTRKSSGNSVNNNNISSNSSTKPPCAPCEISLQSASTATAPTSYKSKSRPSLEDQIRKLQHHNNLKPEVIKTEYQRKSESCRKIQQLQSKCNRENREKLIVNANYVQVQALNLTRDAKPPSPSSSSSSPPSAASTSSSSSPSSLSPALSFPKANGKPIEDNDKTTSVNLRRENDERCQPRFFYHFPQTYSSCETMKRMQVPTGNVTETPFCDTNVRVKQEKYDCTEACHFRMLPVATEAEEEPTVPASSPFHQANVTYFSKVAPHNDDRDRQKNNPNGSFGEGQNQFQLGSVQSSSLNGLDWSTQPSRKTAAIAQKCEKNVVKTSLGSEERTSFCIRNRTDLRMTLQVSDHVPNAACEAVSSCTSAQTSTVSRAGQGEHSKRDAATLMSSTNTHLSCNSVNHSSTATLVQQPTVHLQSHQSGALNANLPPEVARPVTTMPHSQQSEFNERDVIQLEVDPGSSRQQLDSCELNGSNVEVGSSPADFGYKREASMVDDKEEHKESINSVSGKSHSELGGHHFIPSTSMDLPSPSTSRAKVNVLCLSRKNSIHEWQTTKEPQKALRENGKDLSAQNRPLEANVSKMALATTTSEPSVSHDKISVRVSVDPIKSQNESQDAPQSLVQKQHGNQSSNANHSAFHDGQKHSSLLLLQSEQTPTMPFDYTTRTIQTKHFVPSTTSTTTVTTTKPVTQTSTSMSTASQSSFQSCFSEHVQRTMTSSLMPPTLSSPPSSNTNLGISLPSLPITTTTTTEATTLSLGLRISPSLEKCTTASAPITSASSNAPGTLINKLTSVLRAKQQAALATSEAVPSSIENSKMGISSNHHVVGSASLLATKKNLDSGDSPSKAPHLPNKAVLRLDGTVPKPSDGSDPLVFSHTITTGSSIPVGIAVARQRQDSHSRKSPYKQRNTLTTVREGNKLSKSNLEQHINRAEPREFIRGQKELLCLEKPANGPPVLPSSFSSNLIVAGSATTTTTVPCWDDATKPGASLQTRWMSSSPHGHSVGQTLWLGQGSYSAAPAPVPMQISSMDPSHLQFPPLGYQLARDPITNHLFLIPAANIDVMERPPLWPAFATSATATPPQLQPHHNPFQQFIFQQQQQQILQQDSQSTTIEFRLQQEPPSVQEPAKNSDIPLSHASTTCNESNINSPRKEAVLGSSIKGEDLRNEDFKEKATMSLATHSPIIASIPVSGQAFPYVIPAPNAMPYFFDPQTATAVVHVTPAASTEPLHLDASDKRSQGTSPVPCSDMCLTPPSDGGGIPVLVDSAMENDSGKIISAHLLEDGTSIIKAEPVMADACNQTETPPMTDEEDDDEDEGDTSSLEDESSPGAAPQDRSRRVVKVEDISVQCELLDELLDIPLDSSERKPYGLIDVHGLELLSNIIEERHETYCNPVSTAETSASALSNNSGHVAKTEQNVATNLPKSATFLLKEDVEEKSNAPTKIAKFEGSENGTDAGSLAVTTGKSLGGLGLLCALAEQRILQETLESSPQDQSATDVKEEDVYTPCPESPKDQVDQDSEGSKDPNRNSKNAKSHKEFRDFIAHKSIQYASVVNKNSQSDAADMDSAELEMRLRLADLQKKYKEKQKELAKLLPKKEKDMLDKSCTKRGPGRPRKRKCLPLYKSRIAKFHFDKLKSPSKKEHALMAWQSLVHGTSSKKMSCSSSSKTSKAVAGIGKARDSRPILKPAVLNPQKMSSSTNWLSDVNLGVAAERKSPAPTLAIKINAKPLTFGGFNFLTDPSSNRGTPIPSFKMSLKPVLHPSSTPLSPQSGQQVEVKDTITTPEDSTTDNYDSDDSSCCMSGKSISQKSACAKEVANKSSKRKECSKSSKNEPRKVLRADEEDSTDLSKSFSSLSVSCTMPPFQGCEEPSGLGLLAKYASQVVEQSSEVCAPKSVNTSCIVSGGNKGTSSSDQEAKHKLKGTNRDGSSEQDLTSSSKRRKPGRPKKHSPVKPETAMETIVAKKPKVINFLKSEPSINLSRLKMSPHPKPAKTGEFGATSKTSNSPNSKCSFLTDEAWLRRRSERIFLSEASTAASFTMTDTVATPKKSCFSSLASHPLPPVTEGNEEVGANDSSPLKYKPDDYQKIPKAEKIRSKKRSSKDKPDTESPSKKQKVKQLKGTKDRSSSEIDYEESNVSQNSSEECSSASGLSPSESEPDSPGNSSFSEGDNLPLSKLIEQTVIPEPRSCVIKAEELQDSLRVLTMMDGLFYAGFINAIRAPDVYGITIDGERGNRPHIYSREEILQEAIIEVKPESMQYLPEGTRVCAYWSQQYRCLYPGTVSKSSSPNPSVDKNCVNVEFDDGDSGRIPLDNIRLLPPGLPIISYEPDPVILGKRRTKSTGDLSREKRTIVPLHESSKPSQSSQAAPGKSLRLESPSKLQKGKTNALAGNGNGVSENPDRVLGTKPASSASPVASASHDGVALKAKYSNSTLKQLRVEARKCDFKPNSAGSNPGACPAIFTLATSSTSTSQSKTSVATLMSATTVTTSSVVSLDDICRGANKGEAIAASSSKPKKRKKHRERGETPEKKHRHHHHHHHAHKHKRKHEKHEKQDDKATSENAHVVSTSSHSMPKSRSLAAESKKSELTLTIKTNNTDLNQAEAEEVKKGNNAKANQKDLDEGLSASQSEDREDTSDSSTDTLSQKSEDSPPTTKKKQNAKDDAVPKATPKTKKERSNSVETKSKIAAFLPARQLWSWSGKSFRRPGTKGKAKKEFYKSITRGKEVINVGDSAVFLSTGRPHLPYIGRIVMMWEAWGGNMVVKVKWFYHPEETKDGKKLLDNKGALYQSIHVDENDVQTISHKCEVLSWAEYKAHKEKERTPQSKYGTNYDNNDIYYLAGSYEPTTCVVTMEPGVS